MRINVFVKWLMNAKWYYFMKLFLQQSLINAYFLARSNESGCLITDKILFLKLQSNAFVLKECKVVVYSGLRISIVKKLLNFKPLMVKMSAAVLKSSAPALNVVIII